MVALLFEIFTYFICICTSMCPLTHHWAQFINDIIAAVVGCWYFRLIFVRKIIDLKQKWNRWTNFAAVYWQYKCDWLWVEDKRRERERERSRGRTRMEELRCKKNGERERRKENVRSRLKQLITHSVWTSITVCRRCCRRRCRSEAPN